MEAGWQGACGAWDIRSLGGTCIWNYGLYFTPTAAVNPLAGQSASEGADMQYRHRRRGGGVPGTVLEGDVRIRQQRWQRPGRRDQAPPRRHPFPLAHAFGNKHIHSTNSCKQETRKD